MTEAKPPLKLLLHVRFHLLNLSLGKHPHFMRCSHSVKWLICIFFFLVRFSLYLEPVYSWQCLWRICIYMVSVVRCIEFQVIPWLLGCKIFAFKMIVLTQVKSSSSKDRFNYVYKRGEREREMGIENMWRNNGWQLLKLNRRCELKDPRSSANSKQKELNKPHIRTYYNQLSKAKYKENFESRKREVRWLITYKEFSISIWAYSSSETL